MREKLIAYIRSGHAGLYAVTAEETRFELELQTVAADIDYRLYAWSITDGLIDVSDGSVRDAPDPLEVLNLVADLPENSVVVLRDYHQFLEDGNPVLIRTVKDVLATGKATGKCLIIVGCRQTLPPELEREFVVLDFDLPDKDQLGTVLDGICESAELAALACDERDAVLDAASGLTSIEAENAFALSVVECKSINPDIIAREKANTVKRNGLVEIIDVTESLESIGGLDALKDWLIKRRAAFSQQAIKYRPPSPKGLLVVGVPGCGKSLTCKASARVFGRPLLKLDAGRIFGGLVGQSESNLRSVIQTAEAIAPCILWIDEIEKGLSGSRSSGSTDGGTSARVFGSFISWMAEKTSSVFVTATANDVSALPSELLRKGRFDEVFFVDLPNQEERQKIWEIQIAKYGRKPADFDIDGLAGASEGYTGSEIEQAFIDALYAAFSAGKEPGTLDVSMAISEQVPLSKLMAEQITALRRWAKGRARPATTPKGPNRGRKIAA